MLWFRPRLLLVCLAGAITCKSVRADDNPLVDKVKSTWRAQDGETVEQITANVAKVAHFVPRTWGVARGIDQSEYVFLSWTWHRGQVTPNGTIKIASTYAKPMELGWRAFALSLIAGEVSDDEKDVNLGFLHDPANFNFVTTAQGKLGNLLGHGRARSLNLLAWITCRRLTRIRPRKVICGSCCF
ncbi:hypothetical protein J4G43_042820 [Bradyrhizobium barranii subsp. barranii]|uniref:Uncharacterized protein n=1 Tax=Bradyrhizobium barranii subsp. barranii TaxID=2823807 RepID=A0A9X9XUA6_9BRAD|nr:hypothetical protein [Bradyrhizobium barranii]UEM11250.1 hypothetical protein J4G43_042820 [Bradyrhizobium barranii subsp. barranii]